MEFEWDPAKSEATFRIRGFDFAYASRVFRGFRIEEPDTRTDYGEARIRTIGQAGTDILLVVYTVRGERHRFISARRANRKERAKWLSSE
jgi:uncharacterized DUF497 family protein